MSIEYRQVVVLNTDTQQIMRLIIIDQRKVQSAIADMRLMHPSCSTYDLPLTGKAAKEKALKLAAESVHADLLPQNRFTEEPAYVTQP